MRPVASVECRMWHPQYPEMGALDIYVDIVKYKLSENNKKEIDKMKIFQICRQFSW